MRLEKRFDSFYEGILGLAEASYSVEQALKGSITQKQVDEFKKEIAEQSQKMGINYSFPQIIDSKFLPKVISQLAINAAYGSELYVNDDVVDYTTTGGLKFGWDYDKEDNEYIFYISHPAGEFPEGSTLLQAGKDAGWELEI